MSAHQGESSPEVFVFPPFAPPAPRQEAPAPPPAPEPVAVPEPVAAEPEPFGFEVPLPAHDLGDPDVEEAAAATPVEDLGWESTAVAEAPVAEDEAPAAADEHDLPWLEMPEGGPTVHATEEVALAPEPPAPSVGWMAWEGEADSTGQTAEEITPPELAHAGELTSVSAVPSPAMEPEPAAADAPTGFAEEPAGFDAPAGFADEPTGFDAPDPYAPTAEAVHPETMAPAEPVSEAASWPVEAMEPAALAEESSANDVPVVHAPALDHSAFGQIAQRLEEAARALRNDPGSFVATHHDDPLALLIAGYALGYRQGSRAAE